MARWKDGYYYSGTVQRLEVDGRLVVEMCLIHFFLMLKHFKLLNFCWVLNSSNFVNVILLNDILKLVCHCFICDLIIMNDSLSS